MEKNAPTRDQLELSAIERRRVISIKEAARLRGVSTDTLKRQAVKTGKPKIIRISERRIGFRLGEILDV
jgi:predicted DNA-binding transcriptional regulator AlpA